MLASAMSAKVIAEGGFDTNSVDVTAATVLSWINEQYRAMVAAAEWVRAPVEVGPTVVAQALYTLPDTVVQVSRVSVNGDDRWKRVDEEELWDLKFGRGRLYGDVVGVFGQMADAAVASVQKIELWPAPTTAGYTIQLLASVLPADLTTSAPDATPLVPVDVHEHICDGAIGLGRLRVDERADLAQPFLEKYQAGVGMLLKRRRSRVQEGSWQAPVAGRR